MTDKLPLMRLFLIFLLLLPHLCFPQSQIGEVHALIEAKQFHQAEVMARSQLRLSPDNPALIEYLGDIAAHQKKWETAADWYGKLRDQTPESAQSHYKYGGALSMLATQSKWQALKNVGAIKAAFETCLEIQPHHINAHWAMIEYHLQVPAVLGGSRNKARGFALGLQRISPVDGTLARARMATFDKKFALAEQLYLAAIRDFGSPSAKQKLLELYRHTKQTHKASALASLYLKTKSPTCEPTL